MAYADEIAREGARWWAYVKIEGFGRRINADSGRSDAYKFCTLNPKDYGYTAAASDPYQECLVMPKSTMTESIDLRTGRTRLSSFTFDLIDLPVQNGRGTDSGWNSTDLITDLLAVQGPHHSTHSANNGRWDLASNVTASSGTIIVENSTGLSAGDVLWIDSEAMLVTAVGGGTPATVSVTRGVLGTTAQTHGLYSEGRDQQLYDRPRYIKSRRVWLYIGFIDKEGNALPEVSGESHLVWSGIITDWELLDINTFRFSCKPILGSLDRKIGKSQFNGHAWINSPDFVQNLIDTQGGFTLSEVYTDMSTTGSVKTVDYIESSSTKSFYARLGDSLARCVAQIETIDGEEVISFVNITRLGLMGTSTDLGGSNEFIFRDVLLTSPDPCGDGSTVPNYFVDSEGKSMTNPVDIMLALITSTGYITDTAGLVQNGDHDILPANWGAGVDESLLNIQSFYDVRGVTKFTYPRVCIGWQGKPISLLSWLEDNILGPCGWFIYTDENGLISLGRVSSIYPGSSSKSIGEEDIIDGKESCSGQLGRSVTYQTWGVDWNLAKNEPDHVVRVIHDQAKGRYDDDSEIEWNVPGLSDGPASMSFLQDRQDQYAHWFITPLPIVSVDVLVNRLDIALTDAVLLTTADLPNPFTGTRGYDDVNAVVVGRSLDFDRAKIGIDLMILPDLNIGLWCPAGIVKKYSTLTNVVTFESNTFSDPDFSAGQGTETDASSFAVGDYCMILDANGRVRSSTKDYVVEVEPGGFDETIKFSGAWSSVVPEPGNIITFVHYESGNSPAFAWTSNMKNHVAQADDSDLLLPNDDAAYVYGA